MRARLSARAVWSGLALIQPRLGAFIVAIRSPFCRHQRLAQSVGNGLRTPVSASSKISRGWKESSHNKGPDRRLQPPVLTYLLDFMQPFRASGNLRASAGKHNCVG